eukprot:689151-Prorocentrum_minimum.AAC.1
MLASLDGFEGVRGALRLRRRAVFGPTPAGTWRRWERSSRLGRLNPRQASERLLLPTCQASEPTRTLEQ